MDKSEIAMEYANTGRHTCARRKWWNIPKPNGAAHRSDRLGTADYLRVDKSYSILAFP